MKSTENDRSKTTIISIESPKLQNESQNEGKKYLLNLLVPTLGLHRYVYTAVVLGLKLKVSSFRNAFLVSSILPKLKKNRPNY